MVKTYCLTISQNPWRNETVAQRFQDAGLDVEFFYGVHGQTVGVTPVRTVWDAERDNPYRVNPGKLSITISKLLLWQKLLDGPDEEVLILENDVTFVPNFLEEFAKSYAALPADWQVVHVGHCCTEGKPTTVLNDRVSEIKHPLCCHATLWKKSALRAAVDAFKVSDWGTNSDIILQKKVYPKLRHYSFVPPLVMADQTVSEAAQTESWEGVQGWFDFDLIYDEQLTSFGDNPAVVVEVGSWLGRSTAFMAEEIKRRLKTNVKFYAVDTWRGTANEPDMAAMIAAHDGDLYPAFLRNMSRCGVLDYVTPIRKTSVEAAQDFKDGSIDFLFLDAAHDYESVLADLKAWYPKMHYHRCIAGHDIDRPGVRQAVEEMFPGKWRRYGQSWLLNHCHA
jgi:GR25 family glycosyltransferase involved in LPS biosynthesis/cephalosporin hydroxylase